MTARFLVEFKSRSTIARADLITVLTGIDGGVRVKPSADGESAEQQLAHLGSKLARAEFALLINAESEFASLVATSDISRIEVAQ